MRKRLAVLALAFLAIIVVFAPQAYAAELAEGEVQDSELAETVENVEPVELAETVETFEPVEPVEIVEPVEPVEPVEIVEPESLSEPANSTRWPVDEPDHAELIQEGALSDIPRETPVVFASRVKTTYQQFSELALKILDNYGSRINLPWNVYVTVGQARTYYQRLINTNPQLFYVSSNYEFMPYSDRMYTDAILAEIGCTEIPTGDDRLVQQISPQYLLDPKTQDIDACKAELDAAIDEVLKWVPIRNIGTAERIKVVHDWFVRNVRYDQEASDYYKSAAYSQRADDIGSQEAFEELVKTYGHVFDAYGALVERKAVSQGYALGMMAVLNRMGIANDLVKSQSLDHVWNLVELDGFWYHVDAACDDPGSEDGFADAPFTDYFLKSRSVFLDGDHRADDWQTASGVDRDDTSTAYDEVSEPWYVYGPPVALEYSPSSVEIAVGESAHIELITTPKHLYNWDGTGHWSSENIARFSAPQTITSGTRRGTATFTYTRGGVSASFEVTVTTLPWTRMNGAAALDTMRLIVEEGFPSAKTVVIATDAGYKDALAAASLAGLNNAPILLTAKDKLYTKTRDEIKRLGATKAIVVGGPLAVSDDVLNQLKAAGVGTVTRVWGKNAPDTARVIAKQIKKSSTVIIAASTDFADALSIAPWAWAKRVPIILADSKGLLSDSSYNTIKSLGAKEAVIVGGSGRVSDRVKTELEKKGLAVTRLADNTGATTSLKIAEWELERGFTLDHLGAATRYSYKDALCATALMGKLGSPLVIISSDYPTAPIKLLTGKSEQLVQGYIFGGEKAITALAEKRMRAII